MKTSILLLIFIVSQLYFTTNMVQGHQKECDELKFHKNEDGKKLIKQLESELNPGVLSKLNNVIKFGIFGSTLKQGITAIRICKCIGAKLNNVGFNETYDIRAPKASKDMSISVLNKTYNIQPFHCTGSIKPDGDFFDYYILQGPSITSYMFMPIEYDIFVLKNQKDPITEQYEFKFVGVLKNVSLKKFTREVF